MMKILDIISGNSMSKTAYCINSMYTDHTEECSNVIEFDQDRILEDLLAAETPIIYKGDTVTVEDILASFQ